MNATVKAPFHPTPRQLSAIKTGIFLLALLPFLRLVLFAFTDRLGANPIEFITRSSGDWTLYLLCITLAVTPLRKWLQWPWLIKVRRMLGLFVFFYACLHFTTFIWFDHFFDLPEILRDVVKRPFSLSRCTSVAAFAALITLLAACGQKGPLYLEAKRAPVSAPSPAVVPSTTPATTPAPLSTPSTPASIPLPVTP